ncbi:MAG TPA: FtsW/RodA/SpoVE family cell cycle protein [Caldisericia bacterium]|nr:FtsW/RodA/SpoVE family cell cycle protein [Caldisericia bacterium]HQL67196.1 FtsW/RodA/SpoVE family cell cycle protein [Caldisericia bacterium]
MKKIDYTLFFIFIILYSLGLLWQFSASGVELILYGKMETFTRFLIYSIISIAAMFIFIFIPKKFFIKYARPIFYVSFLLLILVYIPFLSSNGEYRRWIYLFGLSFQPSELFKLSLIIFASYILSKDYFLWEKGRDLFPLISLAFIGVMLIIFETDFSTAVLTYLIFLSLLFVGTYKTKHFYIPFSLLIFAPIFVLLRKDWLNRIIGTLYPFKMITKEGYQIVQSLIAIGSGGLFGSGYMNGKQKFLYVPLLSKDFIFSLICEETGLIGGAVVIFVYFLLLVRGYSISMKVSDVFFKILSFGITTHIFSQAILIVGVNLGLFPVTGLTLPFISYGGSSLLISGIEAGILLNISRFVE